MQWPTRHHPLKLTFEGAQKLLAAAIAKAKRDQSAAVHLRGRFRRAFADDGADGRRFCTVGRNGAAQGADGGRLWQADRRYRRRRRIKLAIATEGKRVNLPGGLPVIVDGHVVGAIGVGSGTGEQDREVAAALAAPWRQRF